MCKLILFLTMCIPVAADSSLTRDEDEVCLLSLRAKLTQRRSLLKSQQAALTKNHEESLQWSKANTELKRQLMAVTATGEQTELDAKEASEVDEESVDGAPPTVSDSGVRITTDTQEIDDFIMDQMVSKDTCTSEMMEAKRTIDGIAAKVMQLSDEIEAENSIINSQKMVVDRAIESLEESEAQEQEDLAACQKTYEEQWAELDGKRNEIVELEQIANPSVRSSIAHDMDVEAYVNKHVRAMESRFRNTSMEALSAIAITEENCKRVVDFLNARAAGPFDEVEKAGIKYSVIDCTAARQRLQDEFTEAYIEITKLITDGEAAANSEKERCDLTARNEEDERSSQLDLQISRCTADITAAKDTIHELEPLLSNGEEETKNMERYLERTLSKMCEEDEKATEHLKAVRRLIMSLEKCPGRNDFKLMIPGQHKENQKVKR
jgi:hypothetical protein